MKTKKYNVKNSKKKYYYFNNYTNDLEFSPEVYKKIEKGLKDIEEGRYKTLEQFMTEMEAKYHINE